MSNLELIQKELLKGKTVYLYDSFENAVCKIFPENKVLVKFKGGKEFETDSKSSLVFEMEMGGKFISEKQYNEF